MFITLHFSLASPPLYLSRSMEYYLLLSGYKVQSNFMLNFIQMRLAVFVRKINKPKYCYLAFLLLVGQDLFLQMKMRFFNK